MKEPSGLCAPRAHKDRNMIFGFVSAHSVRGRQSRRVAADGEDQEVYECLGERNREQTEASVQMAGWGRRINWCDEESKDPIEHSR